MSWLILSLFVMTVIYFPVCMNVLNMTWQCLFCNLNYILNVFFSFLNSKKFAVDKGG